MPRKRILRSGRIRVDGRAVRYLVDANVLSEPTKPVPHVRVVEWLRDNERDIAVDPIILGEIRFGILLLPRGKRRARLEQWLSVCLGKRRPDFVGQSCLPVSERQALRCRSKIV